MILLGLVLASGGLASADAVGEPRLLGLNIHQSPDVGVAVTEGCKGHLVRLDFNWFQAEPTQGVYDWTVFDAVVNAAAAKGFSMIATVGYTPDWAAATPPPSGSTSYPVPMPGTYDAFVSAAVSRYQDRVKYWELWNEPNLSEFFAGTATDYVNLIVKPGAAAVHAACPGCKTLAPCVATVGTNYADWMKTVFTHAASSIDIVSGHDYADFVDMGAGGTSPDFFSKLEKHRVIKFGGSVLYEDPLSIRESMVKYGVADKPFWMTETGYEATYGDVMAMATQAHYVTEVLNAMVPRTWWTATTFYEAFDVSGQPYHWGFALADPDASTGYDPKPVCNVLATPPDWDAAILPDAEAGTSPEAGVDAAEDASEAGRLARDAETDAPPPTPASSGGCSCRSAPGAGPAGSAGMALAATVLLARRRRRSA